MINQTELFEKLYSTIWVQQCKDIDTDLLDFEDAVLVQKCIHQEEATFEEKKQLSSLLKLYTNIDEEYNITATEENIEQFEGIISDERAFLDLVNVEENYTLKMKYFAGGKTYIMEFIVKPVQDSRALGDIIDHAEIFSTLSDEDKKLYEKAENGTISDREKRILNRLNDKIESRLLKGDNIIFMIDNFLTRQVELKNSTLTTDEERYEFWQKMDISYKISLYEKAREILHLNDMPTNELFL